MDDLMLSNKYIAIDTESTGFQPDTRYSKLLEIGAVKIVDDKVVDRFDRLINPGMKIPKKISELTGITDDMVINEKDYCSVLADFRNWCEEGYVFIFHNAPHDVKFLNFFGEHAGVSFNEPVVDTMTLASKWLKVHHPECKTDKGRIDTKLSTLARIYEIPDLHHHRADNDAELTWNVFKALREEMQAKGELVKLSTKDAPEAQNKTVEGTVTVLRANVWEKKKMQRLYVDIKLNNSKGVSYGTVYYDFVYKNWGIKEVFFPIKDFSNIEEQVKKMFRTNEMNIEAFH